MITPIIVITRTTTFHGCAWIQIAPGSASIQTERWFQTFGFLSMMANRVVSSWSDALLLPFNSVLVEIWWNSGRFLALKRHYLRHVERFGGRHEWKTEKLQKPRRQSFSISPFIAP